MILKLDDKRSLQLPDEMPDETARQLKAFLLSGEQRATDAEARVQMLLTRINAMEQKVNVVHAATVDNTAVVAAIARLESHLHRVLQATMADRMIVPDPITGDMTRSRVVL